MKRYFIPLLSACLLGLNLSAEGIDFHDHIGLQLWSLRAQFPRSPAAAMDLVNSYGITEIETAGTAGLSVSEFSKLLGEHKLAPIGAHIGYEQFARNLKRVISDMKSLGVTYVTIPVVAHPHSKFLTAKQAHEDAANLNKWGAALKAEGLQLGVHTHGFEFTPLPESNNETGMDILMRETNPDLVVYEMDVFWVYAGGGNPVELLNKYPDRWLMLHIKDFRQGADRADGVPAHTKAGDDVAVGTGVFDWKKILSAAKQDNVKFYFIEDETVDPLKNIPLSVGYLRALKL
jgi:hypothetical protein